MPRLLVGNFAFEEELSGHRQILPDRLRRLESDLATCWDALAHERDLIWSPAVPDDRFQFRAGVVTDQEDIPPGLELTPWGWTDRLRHWGRQINAVVTAPQPAAVHTANSRLFAADRESRWRCGLEGTTLVSSLTELAARLDAIDSRTPWIVRTEFSGSARERLLASGRNLTPPQRGWLQKRFAHNKPLIWEPWVERITEVSLHWTIPSHAAPRFDGLTGLVTDTLGRYRGSLFGTAAPPLEEWSEALDLTGRLAAELQQLGYFGPLGVDALRYRDLAGNIRVRPLQDVNARWTMGRLSLGWIQRVPGGLWRHGTPQELLQAANEGRVLHRTSPERIGNQQVKHSTWIEPPA